MSDKTDVTLFVKVSPDTHQRLAILAAQIDIGKGELYRQALRWAIRQKGFRDALRKIPKKK